MSAEGVGLLKNLLVRREILLVSADEGVANRPGRVDEEQGRPGDIPRVETDWMPDAIRLGHGAGLVDQDVERQAAVFDISPHDFGTLRDYGHHLRAAPPVLIGVICQFTEPAAAVRSPRAPMKREEHRPVT